MTSTEVKMLVVEVLGAVVTALGAAVPPIDDDLRPIGTLPSFDSILAEDTTVELFERLGLAAEIDVNPFIKGRRAATVGEVVSCLHDLVTSGEQK